MEDIPRIVYNEFPDYTKEDLDEIFTKLLRYEEGYSEKMVEIRKQQILKHTNKYFIIDILNDLAKLIGMKYDENTKLMMEHCEDLLRSLHSPFYFNIKMNLQPFHKWEEWTFEELAAYYFDLMVDKGFEDRYVFDIINNRVYYSGEWTEGIKNYHVIDMLNDLVIYDSKICGYEFRSFMSAYGEDRMVQDFNHDPFNDYVIDVKLTEKYTLEELNNLPIIDLDIKEKKDSFPGIMRKEFDEEKWGDNILESILFKHNKIIKKKNQEISDGFLTDYLIKTAHKIPEKLEHEYKELNEISHKLPIIPYVDLLDLAEDYAAPKWIKCGYRMRRLEEHEVKSYCLNPFNPMHSSYGLWLPVCAKNKCELNEINED